MGGASGFHHWGGNSANVVGANGGRVRPMSHAAARAAVLQSTEADLKERGLSIPLYPLENRMDDRQIIIGRPMTQASVFWCGLFAGLFLGLFIGLVFWELT